MLGHFSFSLRAMPVMVPPVPAPATSMSILPADAQPGCHHTQNATHTHTFTARCDSVCMSYHHTAPGSPLPWCRSEPAGYPHSGTDPEYGSWGSHSSGTRPRPRETPESQNGRRLGSEQSQHQEHAARPPELHNKITLYITFNTNPKATTF